MVDIKKIICILITIITILILLNVEFILNRFPIIKFLFTDTINHSLLTILVVFVMLIDLYSGLALGLIILYISVYITKNITGQKANVTTVPNTSRASNMTTVPNISRASNMTNMTNMKNISTSSINDSFINVMNYNASIPMQDSNINNINNINPDEIRSESEFIYDNTKPFPNKNLKPFQSTQVQTQVQTQAQEKFIDQVNTNTNTNDYITQVGQPDRSGYDVTGCRYDMKNSPQNLTQYGPPLAQCSAYNMNQAQVCGTIFYPLNG